MRSVEVIQLSTFWVRKTIANNVSSVALYLITALRSTVNGSVAIFVKETPFVQDGENLRGETLTSQSKIPSSPIH